MARVKGGPRAHARHRKYVKLVKGQYGRRKSCFRTAKQAYEKAGQYAYIGRKQKKRNFRSLWIQRINAACRENGMSYSQFMSKLRVKGIVLNRKMLSEMAFNDDASFKQLISSVK